MSFAHGSRRARLIVALHEHTHPVHAASTATKPRASTWPLASRSAGQSAQAGGKDPSKTREALDAAEGFAKGKQ